MDHLDQLKVYIDRVEDDSHWITGYIGDGSYEFYAKVEDEPHSNAISKGRIVKFVLKRGDLKEELDEDEFWKDVVVNYDRGWVIKPEQKNSKINELMYVAIDELEKVSTYEDRIYGGSVLKKIISKTKNALFPDQEKRTF